MLSLFLLLFTFTPNDGTQYASILILVGPCLDVYIVPPLATVGDEVRDPEGGEALEASQILVEAPRGGLVEAVD